MPLGGVKLSLRKAARLLLRAPESSLVMAARRQLVRLAYDVQLPGSVRLARRARIIAVDGARIVIGPRVRVGAGAVLICHRGTLEVGEATFVGEGTIITAYASVSIGRDTLIAEHVTIRDQDHGTSRDERPYGRQPLDARPIRIGDNCWLGAKVTVLKGVTIGSHAIVGANAVVVRDVPSGARVGGVPAHALGPDQVGRTGSSSADLQS